MTNPKVYCYDKVCNCWVEDFEIHTNNCVSINQVWSTNDVDLYVKKADYDQLKQEIAMLVVNNEKLTQSDTKARKFRIQYESANCVGSGTLRMDEGFIEEEAIKIIERDMNVTGIRIVSCSEELI
jgi:hypothetical protein